MDDPRSPARRSPLFNPTTPLKKEKAWYHDSSPTCSTVIRYPTNDEVSLSRKEDKKSTGSADLSSFANSPSPFSPQHSHSPWNPLQRAHQSSVQEAKADTPATSWRVPSVISPASTSDLRVKRSNPAGLSAVPEPMDSPFKDRDGTMKPTPFAPAYEGVLARPARHPSFTSYGVFADPAKFTDASHGGVHTIMSPKKGQRSAKEILAAIGHRSPCPTIAIPSKSSKQPTVNDSPFSSEAEIHPSSGVALNESDRSGSSVDRHQYKTFEQLEAEKGIIKWNKSMLDDRWATPPATVRSSESRAPSTIEPFTTQEAIGKVQDRASARHMRLESFLSDLRDTEKKMYTPKRSLRADAPDWIRDPGSPFKDKLLQGKSSDNQLVAEPLEAQRWSILRHEVDAIEDSLPEGITFHPNVLRQYFYDRVFCGERAITIDGPERDNITNSDGVFISLGALRNKILIGIERLVAFMTAPAREGIRSPIIQHYPEEVSGEEEEDGVGVKPDKSDKNIPCWRRDVEASKVQGARAAKEEITPKAKDGKLFNDLSLNMQLLTNEERRRAIPPPPQAFSEQLTAIQNRALDPVRSGSAAAAKREFQHQEVKDTPGNVNVASSSLRKKQVDLLRSASHHRTSSQPLEDPLSQTTLTPLVDAQRDTMEANNPFGALPPPVGEGVAGDANTGQHFYRPVGYLPTQQQQPNHVGAVPTGMFYPSGYQGPPSQVPAIQQGHQYTYQPATAFQQSPFAVSQPMQYGMQPMQYGYPQQNVAFAAPSTAYPGFSSGYTMPSATAAPFENRGMAKPVNYNPPPMPYPDIVARPAATNRLAPLAYRNDQNLQNQYMAQVRGTPTPPRNFVQSQTEWQNRFGIPVTVKPDIPLLPYRPESDDMRPHSTGDASFRYQELTREGLPTFETARAPENLPFAEIAKESKPAQWGVLKIGNIPYDLTKSLILNFLGPHAKMITPSLGPAIHIIMDRATGKTMDCFIEFYSVPDARACSNSINLRQHGLNRISDRVVDVSMSSQDELLSVLFPKAKNVKWENGRPVILEAEEPWSSGFKNFVSAEELGLLVRHAEQPHRSNYTQRSPQRCYEAMISLLSKFPWHATPHYKISTRNQIFNATRQMLHILSINIRKEYGRSNPSMDPSSFIGGSPPMLHQSPILHHQHQQHQGRPHSLSTSYGGQPMLTEALLAELLSAGLNAPGFSERQRWELYEMCDYARNHFYVSAFLRDWPFEVLGRKMRVEEDVVELYAALLSNNPEVTQDGTPFGSFKAITENLDVDAHTVEQIGVMEVKMMEALLMGGLENAVGRGQQGQWMGGSGEGGQGMGMGGGALMM